MKLIEEESLDLTTEIFKPSHKSFCPICSKRSVKAIKYNAGYGLFYDLLLCTNCYSHPRHRYLYLYLKKIFDNLQGPIDFLHFAPEAFLEKLIRSYFYINYLSVDLDENKAMQKEDITKMSFADNSFDFILNIHVMEHVSEEAKAYSELYRILKPGGVVLIDVPMGNLERNTKTDEDLTITDPVERTKRFGQYDHVRLYSRDIFNRITGAGLSVHPIFLYNNLSDKERYKYGLYRQFSFLCFKPTKDPHFSIYNDSIMKNLPDKVNLHLLNDKNGYIIDVDQPERIMSGQIFNVKINYLIQSDKKLMIALSTDKDCEHILLSEIFDLNHKKSRENFNLFFNNHILKGQQSYHMLIRIFYKSVNANHIVDEVILNISESAIDA